MILPSRAGTNYSAYPCVPSVKTLGYCRIWASILGVAPFALALPYANLFWVGLFTAIIGLILASAFSAILVYAQELVPGRVGMIAGLPCLRLGGIGSAVLGALADHTSIAFVFQVCSYPPS